VHIFLLGSYTWHPAHATRFKGINLNVTTSANATITSAVLTRLRADIVEGVLAPGSKLVIKDLCDRYGASLIPVREALSRLTSSGFVNAEDQRGFRVASASAKDLLDVLNARAVIECHALERSIKLGDIPWEARLLSSHHELSRQPMNDDADTGYLSADWDEAHKKFHDALLSACDSPVLLELTANLRERSTRYRHLALKANAPRLVSHEVPRRALEVAAEHKAIVEASLARDALTAKRLLQEHFDSFRQSVDVALKRLAPTIVDMRTPRGNGRI
jgi:GntR family carbon starvation induced transcriptional regulator